MPFVEVNTRLNMNKKTDNYFDKLKDNCIRRITNFYDVFIRFFVFFMGGWSMGNDRETKFGCEFS